MSPFPFIRSRPLYPNNNMAFANKHAEVPQNVARRNPEAVITQHGDINVSDMLTTMSYANQLAISSRDGSVNMYKNGGLPANYILSLGDAIFANTGGLSEPLPTTGVSPSHGMDAKYSLGGIVAYSQEKWITGEEIGSKYEFVGYSKSTVDPSDEAAIKSGVALFASGAITGNAPSRHEIRFGDKVMLEFPNTNDDTQKDLSAASNMAKGFVQRVVPLVRPVNGADEAQLVIEKLQKLVLYNDHDAFSPVSQAGINTAKTCLKRAFASMAQASILFLLKRGLVEFNVSAGTVQPSGRDAEMILAQMFDLTSDPFTDNSDLEADPIIADILKTVFTEHPFREVEHVPFDNYSTTEEPGIAHLYRSRPGNEALFGTGPAASTHVKTQTYVDIMAGMDQSFVEAEVLQPRMHAEKLMGSIMSNSNAQAPEQRLVPLMINHTTILN